MKFDEISGFRGLFIQPNTFNLPKGSLEEAINVNIEDRDTVTRCRGFYEYYEYTTDDQEIIGITSFDDKLIGVFSTFMAYFDDTGSSPNITGVFNSITQDTAVDISYSTVDNPTFSQSNGNLYITTEQGVVKLSSYGSDLFQSGSPQGLDVTGDFNIGTSATWWYINENSPESKTVGYRILFGYEDENNNLILGAPSSIWTITNPIVEINSPNVVRSGPGPYTMTVTSVAHGLSTGMNILFYDATSFTTPENAEGSYTITVTSVDVFTYTVDNDPGTGTGGISYALAIQPRLEFSVPSQITSSNTKWFYQVYRSDQQISTVGVQSDFKLVDQQELTSSEISDGVVFYSDNKSELFKGELLYTNQNSGEGELQANFRPPQCQTMDLFQKHMFYGNCRSRHLLNFSVINPTVLTTTSYLEIKVGDSHRRYYVGDGTGNLLVRSESIAAGVVTYTAHGIPLGRLCTIYITNSDGGLSDGIYYANALTADTFQFADSLDNWQSATWLNPGGLTELDFESLWQTLAVPAGNPFSWSRVSSVVTVTHASHGLSSGQQVYISNSTGTTPIDSNIFVITDVPDINTFEFEEVLADDTGTADYQELNYVFYDNNVTTSPSQQIRDAAENLVKAINRDPLSLVYAQYVSSPIDTPGNMRLQSKNFGESIYLRTDSSTTSGSFFPVIPTSYSSGLQVFSADETKINAIYFSKLSEPEAVPLVNFIPVGSSKHEILAIHALTNSLIIIKSDGIFRLSGDDSSNFVVSLLDGTVKGVARRSSTTFSNQVSMLANQGVCLVSETSVQIISRPIENVIQTIVQESTIDIDTSSVSYEIERTLLLKTKDFYGNNVTYCYNILTNAWTTWTFYFSASCVGPDRRLYMVDDSRKVITRERKDNLKTDYSSQNYQVTVIDNTDLKNVLIESLSYVPKYGDFILKNQIINIINGVVLDSPNRYYVSFFYDSNLTNLDSLDLYESYESTIKLAPYTGGQVGVSKQFSQIQAHFRNYACTSLGISFTNDSFDSTTEISWEHEGINTPAAPTSVLIESKTKASPIARFYTPLECQRGTFIQPMLVNRIAGDRINLQSINVSVRTYGERVSR